MFYFVAECKGCDLWMQVEFTRIQMNTVNISITRERSMIILTTRIILCVPYNRGQTAATIESLISSACDAVTNRHRAQTAAFIESIISNACDTIANNILCNLRAKDIFDIGRRCICFSNYVW